MQLAGIVFQIVQLIITEAIEHILPILVENRALDAVELVAIALSKTVFPLFRKLTAQNIGDKAYACHRSVNLYTGELQYGGSSVCKQRGDVTDFIALDARNAQQEGNLDKPP